MHGLLIKCRFMDGWILRFSYFYTHRTNCIEQIGPSSIPLQDKLDYCEEIYEKWGTPAIYKITPLINSSFDQKLTERGYHIAHVTEVMTMELRGPLPGEIPWKVELCPSITPQWLEALFTMKGTVNQIHRRIVPSMYAAIPKDIIAASVLDKDQIVGTGLGILDRGLRRPLCYPCIRKISGFTYGTFHLPGSFKRGGAARRLFCLPSGSPGK